MNENATSVRQLLEAWRKQNVDQLNPVRFHLIEVLERRAADQVGESRRALDARLATLTESYAQDLEESGSRADAHAGIEALCPSVRGALGRLVDDVAVCKAALGPQRLANNTATARPTSLSLPMLDEVRGTWSRLREQSHVRQALASSPSNVGPLNSASLVHRSLTLMQQLSPGYLQHFLAYVDALAWMEQWQELRSLEAAQNARAASAGKRGRGKYPRQSG